MVWSDGEGKICCKNDETQYKSDFHESVIKKIIRKINCKVISGLPCNLVFLSFFQHFFFQAPHFLQFCFHIWQKIGNDFVDLEIFLQSLLVMGSALFRSLWRHVHRHLQEYFRKSTGLLVFKRFLVLLKEQNVLFVLLVGPILWARRRRRPKSVAGLIFLLFFGRVLSPAVTLKLEFFWWFSEHKYIIPNE